MVSTAMTGSGRGQRSSLAIACLLILLGLAQRTQALYPLDSASNTPTGTGTRVHTYTSTSTTRAGARSHQTQHVTNPKNTTNGIIPAGTGSIAPRPGIGAQGIPAIDTLSTQTAIGIGVGVGLAVVILGGLAMMLYLRRRSRRRKSEAQLIKTQNAVYDAKVQSDSSSDNVDHSNDAGDIESNRGTELPASSPVREAPYNNFIREAPDTTIHEAPDTSVSRIRSRPASAKASFSHDEKGSLEDELFTDTAASTEAAPPYYATSPTLSPTSNSAESPSSTVSPTDESPSSDTTPYNIVSP